MEIFAIGKGNAYMGRRTTDKNGNVVSHTPPRWEFNQDGGCVALVPLDQETMEPTGPADIFGDWDAGHYLPRILELLSPKRKINIPNLAEMVHTAIEDGVDICEYCQDCDCRECIVEEWKGKGDDE